MANESGLNQDSMNGYSTNGLLATEHLVNTSSVNGTRTNSFYDSQPGCDFDQWTSQAKS